MFVAHFYQLSSANCAFPSLFSLMRFLETNVVGTVMAAVLEEEGGEGSDLGQG